MNTFGYDLMAPHYNKIFVHQHQANEDEITEYLNNLVEECSRNAYLDVGCGTGIFTEKLAAYFSQAVGIDPSAAMLLQVNNKSNVSYNQSFVEEWKGTDYDLITAFSQVVNHTPNLPNFIEAISTKLNPGGIFCFDIYNHLFFKENKPKKEQRMLDNTMSYSILPTITDHETHLLLHLKYNLNNGKDNQGYEMNMYVWSLKFLTQLQKNKI